MLNAAENILEKLNTIPVDQQGPAALAILKNFYLSDFFWFAKYFLGYKDLEKEVHGQFVKVFESNATRKIVVMPRGSFKSSLGSVAYPCIKLLRNPDATIFLSSELYTNSKNFLREIKGHFQSDKMVRTFGEQVGATWGEAEIIIKTRQRNRKEASITVGGIETIKVGCHYDIIICDDLNSPTNSDTPEKCQKVIDYVKYLMSILNPDGELVIIATRYSERDVVGWLLSEVLGEKYLAEGKMKMVGEHERDNADEGIEGLGG